MSTGMGAPYSMWTRLDDGFYDNPKVLSCSLGAVGLHALALSYCGRHCTGGEIPRNAPFIRARSRPLVKELVRARIWEQTESGWRVHDWSDYNPTAEEARDYQRRMHEVRRQGGKARAASASRTAGRFAPAITSNTAGEVAPAATSPVPVLDPSTTKKEGSSTTGAHAPLNGNGNSLTPEQRALIQMRLRQLQGAPRTQRDRMTVTTIGDLMRDLGWTEDRARAVLTAVAEEMQ